MALKILEISGYFIHIVQTDEQKYSKPGKPASSPLNLNKTVIQTVTESSGLMPEWIRKVFEQSTVFCQKGNRISYILQYLLGVGDMTKYQ